MNSGGLRSQGGICDTEDLSIHSNLMPVSNNDSLTLTPRVGMTEGFASKKKSVGGFENASVSWVFRSGF